MSSLGWTTVIDGKDTSNSLSSFSSIDTYDGYDAAREHVHMAVHWPPVGCEQEGEVFKAVINLGTCAGELAGTFACCFTAWQYTSVFRGLHNLINQICSNSN